MARYIDAEALTAEFKRLTLGENSLIERVFADGVYAVIESFPTADVVPKSKVEQLQRKYYLAVTEREANVKGFAEEIAKAKSEFECLRSLNSRLEKAMGEKEEKIQELIKQIDKVEVETAVEVAKEIFTELENLFDSYGLGYFNSNLKRQVDEIKKKYTEVEDEPN